jgi:predicted dithiol-disulfide oxidoreductase (DUF899 family)
MPVKFPNESDAYRKARDELLRAEIALSDQTERVAEQRRKLPLGGRAKEDYVFEELAGGKPRPVKLSELFASGKDTLFLYGFMFGPNAEHPCPMCTSFLDALDRQVDHISQRINVAVSARSPVQRIVDFAATRGWKKLRLISSSDNHYQADYFAEDASANQWPMANVFVRKDGAIHHFWGSEMLYAGKDGRRDGTDSRHIDMLWPLWNVLDLTPGGRGADFYPKLSY